MLSFEPVFFLGTEGTVCILPPGQFTPGFLSLSHGKVWSADKHCKQVHLLVPQYYILENFHCAVYLPSGSPNPLMERNTELKITAQNVKRHRDMNQAL